jgi:predicted transcriptional regulator of viral defense system
MSFGCFGYWFGFRLADSLGKEIAIQGCGFAILHICSGILNMHAVAIAPDFDQLFATAESQEGYFTMAQALDAGYARSTHSYHVKSGNWVREHRGIYRLRQYPRTENEHLVLWWLWSRDRLGVPQGVYSHTTALSLRDLSDVNPSKLHMTVPLHFRRNSEIPSVLALHKAALQPGEVMRERGYAVTTVIRAIVDCAKSGDADADMLKQATQEGLRRGLITRAEIKAAKAKVSKGSILEQVLQTF